MPATLPGAAWATGAGSDDAASSRPVDAAATTRSEANFNTGVTVIPRRLGLKVTRRLKRQVQQLETTTQGDRHATR